MPSNLQSAFNRIPRDRGNCLALVLLASLLIGSFGCGANKVGKDQDNFFTSGSREADQRASQKMALAEQLEDADKGRDSGRTAGKTNLAARAEEKRTLFERLGGEPGISNIVADFLPRALNDPRINWQRKGVAGGGLFGSDEAGIWKPTPENLAILQKHFIQFLSLTTGGPADYGGQEIKSSHAGMKITNPEFDATIGDLKASLDKLQIPDREQKELLAIMESTRSQIVTER
jgi:hemoglobin